jgi:ADP-ribose pyrophosphatase
MKKWKLISTNTIFKSKWLTLKDNSYELPNGQIQDKYYQIDKHNCVVILAEQSGKIVVIRQYRRGVDEILFELPAGLIDTSESILDTAIRELKEETGYIGEATLLGSCPAQPAFLSMKTNFVLVKITDKIEQKLDGDEDIEVLLLDKAQIDTMIVNGEITDLSFIAGMYYYNLIYYNVC